MNITDKTLQSYIRDARKDTSKKYQQYTVGNNLTFRVHTKTGNATWLYFVTMSNDAFKSGYKRTWHTIGSYPLITLLNARNKAAELLAMVKNNIDPNEVIKQQEISTVTIKQVWDQWYAAADLKPITQDRQNGLYNTHISKLANIPVNSLTDKIAYDTVIKPLLDANHKLQAKAVLSKIKQIMRFAYQTHMIETNPLTDRFVIPDNYKIKKSDRERTRTLNPDELKRFLIALETAYAQKIIDIRYHHLFKLILLLGTRKTELANRKWEHYNPDTQILKLTETKTGDDLEIKLPPQAIILIDELAELHMNDYIFFGSRERNSHLSIRTILTFFDKVSALANIDDLIVHDLRRSFCSLNSERGERFEVIEKAVNHRIQGTAGAYHQSDLLELRYEMLQGWANYIDEVVAK